MKLQYFCGSLFWVCSGRFSKMNYQIRSMVLRAWVSISARTCNCGLILADCPKTLLSLVFSCGISENQGRQSTCNVWLAQQIQSVERLEGLCQSYQIGQGGIRSYHGNERKAQVRRHCYSYFGLAPLKHLEIYVFQHSAKLPWLRDFCFRDLVRNY